MKRRTLPIRLPHDVRGEGPWTSTVAPAGDYLAEVNPLGALWVIATNGHELGIKPGEFEALTESVEGLS